MGSERARSGTACWGEWMACGLVPRLAEGIRFGELARDQGRSSRKEMAPAGQELEELVRCVELGVFREAGSNPVPP